MQRPKIDTKDVAKLFEECKANEVEFIDFRFTDIKGIWHHLYFSASAIDERCFEGIHFDTCSVQGWQH